MLLSNDINMIQKVLSHNVFKSIMTKFVIKNKFRHLYNRAVLFETGIFKQDLDVYYNFEIICK